MLLCAGLVPASVPILAGSAIPRYD